MPQITDIRPLQRDSEWRAIFVDGEFAFSLPVDRVRQDRLTIGLDIEATQLDIVREAGQFAFAKQQALQWLSRRSYSEAEICRKLKQFPPPIIRRVVDFLKSYNGLNDADYARRYATDRLRLKTYSLRYIKAELRAKGLAAEEIEAGLSHLAADVDETESALIAAEKKLKSLAKLEPAKQRNRVYQFLLRRGFNHDVAWRVLERLFGRNIA